MSNVVTAGFSESTCRPLVAKCGLTQFCQEELGQNPGGYTFACVCWMMCVCEKRPNLSGGGAQGSPRTHVVLGQLRLLQSYWGGGWRDRSEGCCQLWLWPRLQPGSTGSYCGEGEQTQLWMGQGHKILCECQQASETHWQHRMALQSKWKATARLFLWVRQGREAHMNTGVQHRCR